MANTSKYRDLLDELVKLRLLQEKKSPSYDEQRHVRRNMNRAWDAAKIALGYMDAPEPSIEQKRADKEAA